MKLVQRIFLILLAFSTLPVAGMGLWMLSSRRAVHDNARVLHRRLALLTADTAQRMLEQMNRTLGAAQDLEIAAGQAKIEVPALRRAAATDSDVALIAILDVGGVEAQRMADPMIFPDQSPKDRSGEAIVAEARRTGRPVIGAPFTAAERTLVPVVHPLSDGRSLYLCYSLRGLQRRLKAFALGEDSRILFTDAAGVPIPGLGDAPAADWRLPATRDGEGWWDSVPSPEGPWVAASAPVQTLGWRAVSFQRRREAYAESSGEAARAVAFGLGLFAVVGVGAMLISRRLLAPVSVLISGAQRVAQGDFSRPVPPSGMAELDTLGATFNAMADKVKHYQALQVDRILEEKAKVDALVRNIPEGVLLVGFDGTVHFANATAARVLGAGVGAAVRAADLAKVPDLKKMIEWVAKGSKRVETVRVAAPAAGSQPAATFACRALPVVREGKEVGVLALMRDITVELELDRMKDEFFHAVVHDLRGPILVIDGMVSFMKKMTLAEKEARYIEMVRMASLRLSDLIANILDIAKLESGTMKLNLSPFSPEASLAAVRDLTKVPADNKGVSIEVAPSTTVPVVGDQKLLDRVLMNLVGNALKFTPSGGKITLAARADDASVEFSVADTGPGIPADKVDAVFEKFKQLDRDAAARAGYGLGLSICRKIVEVHEGRIWVESQEGKGSRFAFRVPRKGPAQKPEAGAGGVASAPAAGAPAPSATMPPAKGAA